MAIRPGFPNPNAMSATMFAVVGIGYVLASMAPHIRAFRNAQVAFNEAKSASIDCVKKFERAQQSMAEAQALIGDLDSIDVSNGIAYLRKTRASVTRFMDDLDLAVVSLDRARAKMKALKRFSAQLAPLHPDFNTAIESFLTDTAEIETFRTSAEELRNMDFATQFDDAIQTAIEHTTSYAMARSLALSAERPRPTAERALASLKKIHESARAHGYKLGA